MPGDNGLPPEFLVKWRNLPYASATWETCRTLLNEQMALHRYRMQQAPPPPNEISIAKIQPYHPPPSNFRPLTSSPIYKGGHTLRPHQVCQLSPIELILMLPSC